MLYVEDNGSVVAIGMGRMFRYPYNQGIKDIVEKNRTRPNMQDNETFAKLYSGGLAMIIAPKAACNSAMHGQKR